MNNDEIVKIKKGRSVVFTFFACVMTAFIVFVSTSLGQQIYEGLNPNYNSKPQKCTKSAKVEDNNLIEIYDILWINNVEETYTGLVKFLPSLNNEIDNLTLDEKKQLVYWYAYQNNLLLDIVDPQSNLKYKGIQIEVFDKIKSYYGIKEDYSTLFNSLMIKQNSVLYEELPLGEVNNIKHDLTSTIEKEDIIITDNSVLGSSENNNLVKQTIKYTFKKNADNKYYLAKSEVVE